MTETTTVAATALNDQRFAALDALVQHRLPTWLAELADYCRLPSEETDANGLRAAAEWTASRLRRLGADVKLLELEGAPPLVVGEIGPGPRTVNVVQHYDVQPAAPLGAWTTPPYDPAIRDGRLFARGATDNKGEFLPRVWAVEAYREVIGALPCRLRFLVEGEEESGSPHLDALLDQSPGIRQADGALIEGGEIDARDVPIIAGGGRGILALELTVRTIAYDAHSSLAVLLPNAAVRLAQALATMWTTDGRPAIAGINVGARQPTEAQLAVVAAMPPDRLADLRREYGISQFIGGYDGDHALREWTFATTLNVQGLWSGYTGPGDKTIIPAEAHARLDIRLVPDQVPSEVLAAVREHLDQAGFIDVQILLTGAERAWWTPPDHPIIDAAARASETVLGRPAERIVSMPGTVPMYQVCAQHRVPATLLGAARDDCHAHAADENVRIEDLATATRIMARFMAEFAALPEVPLVAT